MIINATVNKFDGLSFWFLFCQRLLVAKELLFSRKEPVACHDSILTGDLYFQELMNTDSVSILLSKWTPNGQNYIL